jgi:spore coat protein U-like protein
MHFSIRSWISALLTVAAIGWAGPAAGTTTTATFQVQIIITNACSIDSTSTLNFGSQGTLAFAVAATSSVSCTLALPSSISLDAGTGSGATVTTRKMTGPGSATVNYSLYQDITHLLIWGNTIGTNTMPGIGTGLSIPYTVFGHVPSQATPGAGTYTDTITVTVTY